MRRMMRALLVLVLLVGRSTTACAQDSTLYVYGSVKDHGTGAPLERFLVTAINMRDTADRVMARTNAKGRYELVLHGDKEHVLVYSAVGMLTKYVLLDLRGPDAAQWKDGFGMNINMTLFAPVEGVDFSVLREPVGKCRFDRELAAFGWDGPYAESVRLRLAELMKEVEDRTAPDPQAPVPLDIPVVLPDTTKH
jgi:hypothetical protein